MGTDNDELMTVDEIAKALSDPNHLRVTATRIGRAIDKLGLKPAKVAGITRLFRATDVSKIRDQLLMTSPPPIVLDAGEPT